MRGALGNLRRLLARDDRQRVDVDLLPEHGELFHRRRTAHVERGHEHRLRRAWSTRRLASLAVVVVLPEPCRPTIMIGTGAGALRSIGSPRVPSDVDQLVVNDLHDHLARRHRFDDLDRRRLALHLVDEGAHHVERDVGFEQGDGALRATPHRRPPRSARRAASGGRGCRRVVRRANRTSCRCPARSSFETRPSRAPQDEGLIKHLRRPRAHRAVGRWPPAPGAGRRVSTSRALGESARNLWMRPPEVKNSARLAWTIPTRMSLTLHPGYD